MNFKHSKAPCQLFSLFRVGLSAGEKCPLMLLPKHMLYRTLLSSSCVFASFTGWNDSIGIAGGVGFNPSNLYSALQTNVNFGAESWILYYYFKRQKR